MDSEDIHSESETSSTSRTPHSKYCMLARGILQSYSNKSISVQQLIDSQTYSDKTKIQLKSAVINTEYDKMQKVKKRDSGRLIHIHERQMQNKNLAKNLCQIYNRKTNYENILVR